MSVRVLVADDQALVRAGFRKLLETDGRIQVVGEAADGAEAVELARTLWPDVVLMDIRMPRLDGIEATRRLAGSTRVLVLTTFGLDEYVVGALRAGASGFLLKDAPPEELLAAVHVVARGDARIDPSVSRAVIAELGRRPVARHEHAARIKLLSPRELEVLRLLARGLSNAEVARELVVTEGTAKTHVAHVLQKLGVRDRLQAVVFAYEAGAVD